MSSPMDRLEVLEKKVAQLETELLRAKLFDQSRREERRLFFASVQAMGARILECDRRDYRIDAVHDTFRSILREIAALHGVHADDFEENFEIRRQFFRQLHLERLEINNPGVAATIDNRPNTGGEIPEYYPPMFPEQSGSQ